jgi:hypothetical protein
MRAWSLLFAVAGLTLVTGVAQAHDFRLALLSLTEVPATPARSAAAPGDEAPAPGATGEITYDVVWRVPLEAADGGIAPIWPEGTRRLEPSSRAREGDSLVVRFRIARAGGLGGGSVRLGGSSPFVNEVLVRYAAGGRVVTGRFPRAGSFVVPEGPATGTGAVALTYVRLGVEHTMSGLDHLAFVLGLVLLALRARTGFRAQLSAILRAVTAFTVAHSLTLAAAALGYTHVPAAPVEATIALSIVFVARELVLRARPAKLTSASPSPPSVAPAAFVFGLLHGLGFAGALSEVGLPAGDIPLALFTFNVGVELGQLAFVAFILLLRRALSPVLAAGVERGAVVGRLSSALTHLPAAAIGTLGAYWLFERVAAFF